jgi:hypothetical protein
VLEGRGIPAGWLASVHTAHLLVQQDEYVLPPLVQQLPVEFTGVTGGLASKKQCFLDPLDHGGHLLPWVPAGMACGLGEW